MNELSRIISVDASLNSRTFKKGTIIQQAGEYNSFAYYVKKGLLRSYKIDEKGKEHVFTFASEGWIVADIESQEFDQPTELFIDSLEDTEAIIFDRSSFKVGNFTENQLKENAHLLARHIATLQKRVILLMSAPAEKRYLDFLETYPELINRVPQHMIASYLGITPQALSTIRGKMAKKGNSFY